MVMFGGVFGLVALAVWIFCIVDVITTPAGQVRNLPKFVWLAVVVLLVDVGSIAWLVAGRAWNRTPVGQAATSEESALGRPARAARSSGFGAAGPSARRATPRPTNPDDDDEFLASLAKRAEEQRRARERDDPDPA